MLARAALAAGAATGEAVPAGQLPKFKKKKRAAEDGDQSGERPAKKKCVLISGSASLAVAAPGAMACMQCLF